MMDLKKIKEILELPFTDEAKETLVIHVIAKDRDVIPAIMRILDAERRESAKVLGDMNMQLGRVHAALDSPELMRHLKKDGFIQKEILDFYKKHKGTVTHPLIDIEK